MMKTIVNAFIFLLSISVCWFILIKLLEKQLIYFPEKDFFSTPDQFGMEYQDVWITTHDNIKLHAWWIGSPTIKDTVLFFHGNAGNISHRLDRIHALGQIPIRFLLVDYRGYGQSEGSPNENGLYQDAISSYDYLIQNLISPNNIIVFGESLGGAVAVKLATEKKVARLLIESTFSSMKDVAALHYPFLPNSMLPNLYPTKEIIDEINTPLLIVHGSEDDLIPINHAKKLFETAKDPKKFYEVTGAGHNDVYSIGDANYQKKIRAFLLGV